MLDSDSVSSSDSEDLRTTGLIATRAKRSTAGNFYAGLLANLDDEELQKELLAEDPEDVGDYEGSDKEGEDDEDAFESSSDEEDQGPPKEGDEEDLEGEKLLKRQERAEARKKRSVKDARMKIPGGLGRARKRVRLAEGVKGGEGEGEEAHVAPKPKKKSERSNWLPTVEDGPVRQSRRSLAINNRETIHANLAQSAARSEKQRRVMKDAAERERSKRTKHAELTQEERLKRCEKVEKETAKELGRFERDEAEKQRAREEALAKRRRRGVEGPVFRCWSGSVVWEGERVRVGRCEHGSLGEEGLAEVGRPKMVDMIEEKAAIGAKEEREVKDGLEGAVETMSGALPAPEQTQQPAAAAPTTTEPSAIPGAAPDGPVSWLQGIEQYAAQQPPSTNPPTDPNPPINGFTPSAPATSVYSTPTPCAAPAVQPPQPQIYHGWPPGQPPYNIPPQTAPLPAPAPPAPAPPLIREQAQRTLLILQDFPDLTPDPATTTTSKPNKRKSLNTATPKTDPNLDLLTTDPIKSLLLPSSYPPFTPQQQTYILTKPRKKGLETTMPLAPPKARCALTQWEGKFRDPKTGVVYADLHAYKALQRCLAGGAQWSAVLGAWVGPRVEGGVVGRVGMGGRAARGVPEGFCGEVQVKGEEVKG